MLRGSGMVTSGSGLCSFQMMWSCWFLSVRDLQLSLDWFTAKCEAARMRISIFKSEAMVQVNSLGRGGDPAPSGDQVPRGLITSERKMEQQIDRGISAVSAVMRTLHQSVFVKRELS